MCCKCFDKAVTLNGSLCANLPEYNFTRYTTVLKTVYGTVRYGGSTLRLYFEVSHRFKTLQRLL